MEATELDLESGTYPTPKPTFVKKIRLPKENLGRAGLRSFSGSSARFR